MDALLFLFYLGLVLVVLFVVFLVGRAITLWYFGLDVIVTHLKEVSRHTAALEDIRTLLQRAEDRQRAAIDRPPAPEPSVVRQTRRPE